MFSIWISPLAALPGAFADSFPSNPSGAFCRRGTFSTGDALNGQRTFLLYDYARSSVGGTWHGGK